MSFSLSLSRDAFDELARVENLHSYSISDLGSDPEFESLLKLAVSLCEVPIASLVFVDEKTLLIKSKIGLSLSTHDRKGTLASRVVETKEAIMVADLSLDPEFSELPLVRGADGLRFYVGVPLITEEGFAIGVLCLMDRTPRALDAQKLSLLKLLSAQVVALIGRNRYRHENQIQKKMLEESMKLVTLGTMTASILHEINNPLSILQTRATLLGMHVKDGRLTPEKTIESSEKMLETIKRIGSIVSGLRSNFGRGDREPFQKIALPTLIEETLSFMTGRFLGSQIEFDYVPPSQGISITCKPIQISQVLINLLNNAHDAVNETSTRKKWIKLRIVDLEDSVEILVSNNGKPLPSDIAQKIFIPFFTTKEIGKGTGLGLSISQEIVEAHGGELILEGVKKNTTFKVRLPKDQSRSY